MKEPKFKLGDLVKITPSQKFEEYSNEFKNSIKEAILLDTIFQIRDCFDGLCVLTRFPFFMSGEDLILADIDDGGL